MYDKSKALDHPPLLHQTYSVKNLKKSRDEEIWLTCELCKMPVTVFQFSLLGGCAILRFFVFLWCVRVRFCPSDWLHSIVFKRVVGCEYSLPPLLTPPPYGDND